MVIGGSGGIGDAAIRQLRDDGFGIYATYLTNRPDTKRKDNLRYIKCDITNTDDLKSMFALIALETPIIDVVVFSVTPSVEYIRLMELESGEIEKHFQVQVMSLVRVVNLLRNQFEKRHPTRIITIGSEVCIGRPPTGLAHYVIAKSALLGLSKMLAVELAQYNSTANMITPGMVETKLIEKLPKKVKEMNTYQNPLKRIGTTEDIANAISFLASEKSSYLNGANLIINGGNVLA